MRSDLWGEEGLEPRAALSPLAAWALSLGCTVGWGSFVMPSTTFLPNAGPLGTAIAFAFGMVAMLVIAVNYGYMARHCEEKGGVYAYARATYGANHAFICGWCLVLAYCASMISNATAFALVIRGVFGGALQVGPHYLVAGYDVHLGEVLSGMAVIALATYVCACDIRLAGILETVLVVGLVTGVAAIAVLALRQPGASLASAAPSFSPQTTPVAGTLMVVALVPWAYIGFESVSQVAGECRFSQRRVGMIMAVAVGVATVLYLVLNTVTAAIIPAGYADWATYLEDLPNLASVSAVPSFQAGYRMAGMAGLYLFGLTALCAVLSGVVGFYLAASRLVWVMATDGALSRRLAGLHAIHRTPVAATLAVFAMTLLSPLLGRNVLDWIVDLMSLGALVAYLYTSLAVSRIARSRGDRAMQVMAVCGVAVSMLCLALLIVPLPQLGTSLSKESYIILFAWLALGVNFYTPVISRR